jgi:leucyl aminopeptidase
MGGSRAPGADDNGSGSSNLIETLRIFAQGPQPERTVEFYFYAAEELGLVGSGEVARQYKSQAKDVVSVMQLDMTAFPGLGVNNIGSINDFTHPWLQAYLKGIVTSYLPGVTVTDFRCGYGCSDHASWFNEGFPSFAPFEADMNKMNRKIHTTGDVIGDFLNFDHSAIFSKIALAYLMDMSNSTRRVE